MALHFALPFSTGGFVGLDLFFVISGYLVTARVLANAVGGAPDTVRSALVRRWRRLAPAHLLVVATSVPLALAAGLRAGSASRSALTSVLYASNYITPAKGATDLLAHTWSLAVEVQFYVLWLGVLVVALRRGTTRRRLLWVVAVTALAICAWRTLSLELDVHPEGIYVRTDTRADSLLVGALAALLPPVGRRRGARWLAAAGLVAYLAAPFWVRLDDPHRWLIWTALAPWALAPLVMAAAEGALFSALQVLLCCRTVTWIGRHAYCLYLVHFPLAVLAVTGSRAEHSYRWLALGAVLSFALAAVLHRYVEGLLRSSRRSTSALPA